MDKNMRTQYIHDTLETNYMPYAMSVIISRALPEIDGLKPSQRKILYTMYKLGLLKGARTKSANVVGQTMKLHPHGDMAIYETMVRMTRGNESLLHPYIDSKGNMGKVYSRDMAFAAARYTEVKLESICEELFRDIDKDTVDFVDNYDGTLKEPVLLPTAYPNILVNASQGIAVGMASKFCSFNLREVCNATIEYMKNPKVNIADFLIAPDFSTGGELIYNRKQLEKIYETGQGGFRIRAKYRVDKKNSMIEIYEIPYTATAEAVIDAVTALVKDGKIREISDVRDETDLSGLKITLEVKRNTDYELLMTKLFKTTPLEDVFSCNFTMILGSTPELLGIKGILEEWLAFRRECIRRQLTFDADRMKEKLHLLLGLQKILVDIDKAIAIIRNTEKDADVIPNLMKGFDIDKIQAEYIAEIRLKNLNKEYIIQRIQEIESLKKGLQDIEETLGSKKKLDNIIISQLKGIAKKYGQPRKTTIVEEEEQEEVTEDIFIEDYNLKLFLTQEGYMKKIPLTSLRTNPEHKLKEKDRIIQTVETSNKTDILLFSDKCKVYKLKAHELDDNKASELGSYLPGLLETEENEKILTVAATEDYSGFLVIIYENGKVAKVEMQAYATKTNRKKLTGAYYDKTPVVAIFHLQEDTEFALFSEINKVLLFHTDKVGLKSTRQTMGVQVMRLRKGDTVKRVCTVEESGIQDLDYYRTKGLPATGKFLKEEDREDRQMKLFEPDPAEKGKEK
ncbi:MAG: topoisomerase IV [Clostridiaceae bacterium]|nr:topoisomerase IV [Clostridiaceae bacterium]